ncbi:hypothetical protein BDV95DRAFT_605496 [Massariosphaeria phaeospora]|uniref:Cell wall mannoprotein PIR1-like C-terminal domain-containing protein n=1 Tax=Massariosphaeria phaeospora TaxID=100035 RepID=A0A7C8MR16_9PLEO|nr:hypothetical protein BDV95DRAFT_605496 [Massariosphaeria phaeospora]
MKTFVALALAASALATPMPQSSTPEGCSDSRDGQFTITTVNASTASTKRRVERRQLAGVLTLTLEGGNLKDQADRTAYIADNFQFQFDSPPQAGALKTSGFSVCSNGSIALDGSAVWYQCKSGEISNLYDRSWAPQCEPIYMVAREGAGDSPASQSPDGQPIATTAVPAISQSPDGQPIASTALPEAPITQISDGQPQAPTATAAPVTQISDGQPQAPTAPGAPVTQISDGQPQAPTAPGAPVTQISDGQPQAPSATGAPVTQISDGQPQAPSATGAPVTQISDGQPQAPATTLLPPPVTQISDGQPQAPTPTGNMTTPGNSTASPSTPSEFQGAAPTSAYGLGAITAALFALVAML